MEPATQDYLRKAAAAALAAKDDAAVVEILAMLKGMTVAKWPDQQIKLLPDSGTTMDGPAHDLHFWSQFIRDNFIPFLAENGRVRFTSHELFSWIENCAKAHFTTGDLDAAGDGSPRWRRRVTSGIINLKLQGVVGAKPGSRDYEVRPVLRNMDLQIDSAEP